MQQFNLNEHSLMLGFHERLYFIYQCFTVSYLIHLELSEITILTAEECENISDNLCIHFNYLLLKCFAEFISESACSLNLTLSSTIASETK